MVLGENMNLIKNTIKELNKKGVSATVIGIILLLVGLAIVVMLVIALGVSGNESIMSMIGALNKIKSGAA